MGVQKKFLKIIILTLIGVLSLSAVTAAGTQTKIVDMNFEEAQLREVLKAVAEAAQVNLVTDSSVQGKVNLHLQDISFEKALKLITQSTGLDYYWEGNTVVVAQPERIENLYSQKTTRIVKLEQIDLNKVKNLLSAIYPDLKVIINESSAQVVLVGEDNTIEEALNLVNQINFPVQKEPDEAVFKAHTVKEDELTRISSNIKSIFPEIKILENSNKNQLIFYGQKDKLKEAEALINMLEAEAEDRDSQEKVSEKEKPTGAGEEAPEPGEIKIVKIEYADLSNLSEIISNIYPGVQIEKSDQTSRLILYGSKEVIEKSVSLIDEIDKADAGPAADIAQKQQEKEEESRESKETPENEEDSDSKSEPENILKTVKVEYIQAETIMQNIKGIFPELKVEKNENTNSLILYGSPEKVEMALDLVHNLDQKSEKVEIPESEKEVSREFEIKYSSIEEVKKEIENKIGEVEVILDRAEDKVIVTGKNKYVKNAVAVAEEFDRENDINREIVQVNYSEMSDIQELVNNNFPETSINIDSARKKVIIKDTPEELKEVAAFIKKMDTPPLQVLIEARIEEVSRTELKELGISPDQLSQISFIKDDEGFIEGMELTLPDFLKMMEDTGTTETLANPRLMTVNGEQARLQIGDRVPVKVEKVEEGQTVSAIEYIDAGITLEFEPWITGEDSIILDVKPSVKTLGDAISGGMPSVNTREADTRIHLQNGETFIIGGLIQSDVVESMSRVPVLSEIPILGEFFKHRQNNKRETELLIIITPQIIKDSSEMQTEKIDDTKIFDYGDTSIDFHFEKEKESEEKESEEQPQNSSENTKEEIEKKKSKVNRKEANLRENSSPLDSSQIQLASYGRGGSNYSAPRDPGLPYFEEHIWETGDLYQGVYGNENNDSNLVNLIKFRPQKMGYFWALVPLVWHFSTD